MSDGVWIDTHCHLDAAEFDADRSEVIAAARAAGVAEFFVPAIGASNFAAVRDLCQREPGCRPAYGIHPLFVKSASESDLLLLRQYLEADPQAAVGEIGLDGFVAESDPQRQEYFYLEQLKLAVELRRPVLLHVRRAIDQVLKGLRRYRPPAGIAHAFNGSRQQADEFIRLGCMLGFGGAMSFSGSSRIRALAAQLPLSSLVLETDAPDIPPAWLQGGRNTPAELTQFARILAELRGISSTELATATRTNALAVWPHGDCAVSFPSLL